MGQYYGALAWGSTMELQHRAVLWSSSVRNTDTTRRAKDPKGDTAISALYNYKRSIY